MSLAQARDGREEARRLLREGKDPLLSARRRKLARTTPSALTFERFAREWHGLQAPRWKPVHADDVINSLERDVFPALGAYDVADIDVNMVHAVLKKVEQRGAIETAHWLRQPISKVFRYARVKKAAADNPAADLEIVMQPVPKSRLTPRARDAAVNEPWVRTCCKVRS